MKLSAKPFSSPGRSDKFPPPLMRFLRSNVGSRSRGRSRASPMFLRKVHKSSSSSAAAAAAESTQEPSSPKVTCMGQVRVGRSKKPQTRRPRREVDDERPGSSICCAWISHSLLCHRPACRRRRMSRSNCRGELRCVSFTRAWRDCASFFHVAGGRRRRSTTTIREENSPSSKVETETKFRNNSVISSGFREGDDSELRSEEEEEEEEEEEDEKAEAGARTYAACSSPCSPPKNALLLTRSRSAPYRSSSLACRFWSSPLNGAGEAQIQQQYGEESAGEEPKPLLVSEGESRVHPEEKEEEEDDDDDDEDNDVVEEEERFLKEATASVADEMVRPEKMEETNMEGEGMRPPPPTPPPKLMRCKSEPARTAAQKPGFR